jgi:hypothetical protein
MKKKERENIVVLDNKVEASILHSLLEEREIPHVMISYHDSAYNGIFQVQMGWGHVETPMDYIQEVRALYEDIKAGRERFDHGNG